MRATTLFDNSFLDSPSRKAPNDPMATVYPMDIPDSAAS